MKRACLSICLLLCISGIVFGSTNQVVDPIDNLTKERPVVALVLSGGGGRGFAHIAVIEMIEQLGIPVDMVLGTSMGSLIGSLYSAGYSSGDMMHLIESHDMASILVVQPQPTRQRIPSPFEDVIDNVLTIGFSSEGLGNAPSLLGDQQILALLNTALVKVAPIQDFDDLYIPFRCIGTDLVTGEEIVFSNGPLVSAIRSSMSIPLVFPPYALEDGRLVVDGGIVNNMPVDLARALGADIVIAVDVNSDQLVDAERLGTISQVLNQTLQIFTSQNVNSQYAATDLLVLPELQNISTYDFFNVEEIVDIGRAACKELQPQFEELAKTISLTRPLTPVNPAAPGPYDSLPDSRIVAVSRIDVSGDGQDPEPLDLLLFQPYVGRITNAKCIDELNATLTAIRKRYGFASVSFELNAVGVDEYGVVETELAIITRSFEDRASQVYLGIYGSTSMTFGISDPFGWNFHPTFVIGAHFADLTRANLDVDLIGKVDNAVRLGANVDYPVLQVFPTRLSLNTGLELSVGSLSIVNMRTNPHPISSVDFRGTFAFSSNVKFKTLGRAELGARVSLIYLGAQKLPANVDPSTIPAVDKWNAQFLVIPMGRLGLVWGGIENGLFSTNGIRTDILGEVGYASGSIAYKVAASVKQIFQVSMNNSLWYELSLGFARLAPQLLTSYFDYGTWSGMPGYGGTTYRRDILLGGIGWQYSFQESFVPMYVQVVLRVGSKDSYNPYAPGQLPNGPIVLDAPFSKLDGIDAGIGVGFGFTSPIGDFLIGFGANLNGKFSICIEMW